MKEAIRLSIEGGYNTPYVFQGFSFLEWFGKERFSEEEISLILLDPLFWKCLGKSLRLDSIHYEHCAAAEYHEFGNSKECDCSAKDEWKVNWHRFIDHLANGGNADEFFTNLIK